MRNKGKEKRGKGRNTESKIKRSTGSKQRAIRGLCWPSSVNHRHTHLSRDEGEIQGSGAKVYNEIHSATVKSALK